MAAALPQVFRFPCEGEESKAQCLQQQFGGRGHFSRWHGETAEVTPAVCRMDWSFVVVGERALACCRERSQLIMA
jgi:hypothetical protein